MNDKTKNIAEKLTNKTYDGKIIWEELDENCFQTILPPGFVIIEKNEDIFGDSFKLSINNTYGDDNVELVAYQNSVIHNEDYTILSSLYNAAIFSTYGESKTLEDYECYLDTL